MKKVSGLLVMDVDGTLIRQEGINLLAQAADMGEKVAEITAGAMNGDLDFATSLHARVELLRGLETSVFPKILEQIDITRGAGDLITELRLRGYKIGLVSGGFHEVIDPIAQSLGIDLVQANRLEVADGRLTGKVLGEVVTPEKKKETLWTAFCSGLSDCGVCLHDSYMGIGAGIADGGCSDLCSGIQAGLCIVDREKGLTETKTIR